MIARHWRGLAKRERAEDYVAHLRHETFPMLSEMSGFIDARILKRDANGGVEFVVVTHWESLHAIRQFAGESIERAVVPRAVEDMMVDFDRLVRHYEVIE
jgi:heme-degrading monooxygenase HmoA